MSNTTVPLLTSPVKGFAHDIDRLPVECKKFCEAWTEHSLKTGHIKWVPRLEPNELAKGPWVRTSQKNLYPVSLPKE